MNKKPRNEQNDPSLSMSITFCFIAAFFTILGVVYRFDSFSIFNMLAYAGASLFFFLVSKSGIWRRPPKGQQSLEKWIRG